MNKTLLILSFVAIIIANAIPAQAPVSSTYQITIENIGGGAGGGTSLSYGLRGGMMERELGELVSLSAKIQSGFIPGAFQVIFAPIVVSIDPSWGYNISLISVKIAGANFLSGAEVKLQKENEEDIEGVNVTVSSSEINCQFDLAGKTAGFWDVKIINPDSVEDTLANGFGIRSYPLSLGLVVNSPNPFDPAREPTTIIYRLEADTDVNVYLFTTTADLVWKRSFAPGENGARSGDNSITWNGITDFGEMSSNGVYLLHVVERTTGKTIAKGKIAVLRQ